MRVCPLVNRIDNRIYKYQDIVNAFGPHGQGDPDKTLAEWQLTTPYGWAEIYDYKSYFDSPEEVEEWHVQAESNEAFEWVYQRLDHSVSGFDGSEGI
jgi:hypothetical protein